MSGFHGKRPLASALDDHPDPVSAAELGELLGISRVSARRYLERLVEAGLAAREPRYGHAGRPELMYSARR